MERDNLYFEKAREDIMCGVSKAAKAVGKTMGTRGANSLIECLESPGHFSTNDGITILSNMVFSDPLEELGRRILLEAVSRANKASGDGSSTTCVLTSAILEEGMNVINSHSPMEIKKSLEDCIPLIENSINKQKKEISIEEIGSVASISAEDESIGKIIQEIYSKIGKDGIINWDISKTPEDSYELGSGITVSGATYVSPYMCDLDSTGKFTSTIRWKNPTIVLFRQKITSVIEFDKLFYQLNNKNKKEVIIFCEDVEIPAISDFILTRIKTGFKVVVIKMPILWKDEWWEDLSLASGAKIIDTSLGLSIFDTKEEDLGTFGNITITKEDTHIDGIKNISLHIAELQTGNDEDKIRAARLNTRTARYFVGAHSETALAYRRLKVEDAINSSSLALENGVVVGGGKALFNTINELGESIGASILKEALKVPLQTICKNAGINIIEEEIQKQNIGYNSQTGKAEDLLQNNIVDPTSVVLNSVKSAIGVAASILTDSTVILLPRKSEPHYLPNIVQ